MSENNQELDRQFKKEIRGQKSANKNQLVARRKWTQARVGKINAKS